MCNLYIAQRVFKSSHDDCFIRNTKRKTAPVSDDGLETNIFTV